jgi:hypothetical protein
LWYDATTQCLFVPCSSAINCFFPSCRYIMRNSAKYTSEAIMLSTECFKILVEHQGDTQCVAENKLQFNIPTTCFGRAGSL